MVLLRLGVQDAQHRRPSGAALVLQGDSLLQTLRRRVLQHLDLGRVLLRQLEEPLHHVVVGEVTRVVRREQLHRRPALGQR